MTSISSQPSGRNQCNQAELRLLKSALNLFAEKGYEGTSIREIIEDAGVTRPVLYYYFKNKEALFERVVHDSFTGIGTQVDAVISTVEGCKNRLRAVMRMAFQRAEESPETFRLVLQVLFSSPQNRASIHDLVIKRFERLEDIMRDGIATGELAGGDPDALSLAFAGLMDIHLMGKAHIPRGRLTDALADGLVDLFFQGASRESGVRQLTRSPFSTKPANE